MARDRITAVILRGTEFEWTTVYAKNARVAESERRAVTPAGAPGDVVPPSDEAPVAEVEATAEAEEGTGESPASGDGEPTAVGVVEQIKPVCARFKGHTLVGALNTDQILLRVVELPVVDASELQAMVSLQVDKFSPFPVDTMVVSHEVLRRDEDTCAVLIAAAREEVVNAYGDLLGKAGARPDRVDAVIMGWWRLLHGTDKIASAGRQAFLFLEDGAPELIVTQDGIPILFRCISGLGELSPVEAASEIAAEVAHSLMSLELEHGGGASTRIYLWSREAAPELVSALEAECDGRVEAASLDELPPVSEGVAGRAAASRARDRINLTPDSWTQRRESAHFQTRVILYSSVVLLVWVLCLAALLGGLAYERHRLAVFQERFAVLHEGAEEVDEMRRRAFLVERYVDVSDSALEALRAISMVQPAGIDLNSFSYRKGEGVRVKGEADGVNMVYSFKNRLDESGVFLESELFGPRRDSRRRKDIFEIVLQLPGDAE